MYLRFLCILMFLMIAGPAIQAQNTTPEDSMAITATALDYIEGWYAGDAGRMESALHPKLAKRIVAKTPNGSSFLLETSALELVQQTRGGAGTHTPESDRRTDVTILDTYENAASVRIDAGGWVDYMHLARWNGEWKIINVLWEQIPKTD